MLLNHVLIDILYKTCSSIGLRKAVILKIVKRYRALCARNPNNNRINKRRGPRSSILQKSRGKEERLYFQKKLKKDEDAP